ncbi:ABC-three component system protein [Sphingobacterium chuzhouense]|uniref:ABC-three component systems C-terminal domain-containing protein n=1 Tax=Sphingobacterium chuzhouense TaxID=1742264 RepID=A0ABR7XTU3_9SPHI|nr:ABC-three component system protein [Sphingobacterium chuzhouense]MBD1422317.1 hypothetical protein [Sphingobacterium chuzhouense]
MSSRNATASWSGYAHQGKIGLLIALKKIIDLNCENLVDYQVEQETQEDVCLKCGTIIHEVHQVKAYMSTNAINSYKKALQEFEPGSSNYLHTILELQDWETLTAEENPYNVQRYSYSPGKNFCGLDQIEEIILSEISSVLKINGNENHENEDWCRNGYHEYLALLDSRIREQHQYGTKKTYCISIGLDEILQIIDSPPTRSKTVSCAIRSAIYNIYVDFVDKLENNQYPRMLDSHEKIVADVIKMFCCLNDDDLEEFLCQIFPSSTKGKRLASSVLTDDFFIGKDFATTFLKTLIDIYSVMPTIEGGTYPHYKVDKNYLITALQQQPDYLVIVAKNILENDKLNTARYEADYIINENFEGKLSDYAPKNIPRKNGIINQNDLEFITRIEATNKLNTQ